MTYIYFKHVFCAIFITLFFLIILGLKTNIYAEKEILIRPIIAENDLKNKPVITTNSGLKYIDIMQGSGCMPKEGNEILINYVLRLNDGKIIDYSDEHDTSFAFVLGVTHLIQGWVEGMSTMKVGGLRRIIVPPQLAYGSRGLADIIPSNATLVFDVQLIKINPTQKPAR